MSTVPSSPMKEPQPAGPDDSWLAFESAPSWLISLITHMTLILILGLLYQSVPKEAGVELTLDYQADPGLTTFDAGGGGDPGEGGLGDQLDVPIDMGSADLTNVASEMPIDAPSLSDIVDTPLESFAASGSSDSIASDAESLLAAASGSVGGQGSGTGDGGSGSGSGGGHGAGKGTGTGDGTGPGHAYTSMFGLAGEGGNFVYAFDRSQSMNSVYTYQIDGDRSLNVTPLEAAKNELIRSLGDLNEGCRFQIVFYNDIAVMFGGSPTMYIANLPNKEQAKSFVENMKAEANTNHSIALENALACNPDMIFLMTDGEAKDDLSPTEVRRLIRHCKKERIKINVVHFCFEVRETCSLIQLAEGTGGQHRFITLRELAHEKMQKERGTPTLRPVEALPALQ